MSIISALHGPLLEHSVSHTFSGSVICIVVIVNFEIQEGKNDPKKIFMFWSVGCSLLRAEGSSSLGGLRGGLGIDKLELLIKKTGIFSAWKFYNLHTPHGSGSALTLKCWIRIRIKSHAKRKASCVELFSKVQELILVKIWIKSLRLKIDRRPFGIWITSHLSITF